MDQFLLYQSESISFWCISATKAYACAKANKCDRPTGTIGRKLSFYENVSFDAMGVCLGKRMDGGRAVDEIDLVLVEDDPMVLAVNEEFIGRVAGFRIVGTAQSGKEAMAVLKSLRPRLVVLDIYLPDLDGLHVLKRIRQAGVPTDVIMITAAHDVATIQEFLRLGVIDYIIKPFKFQRIANALTQYREYAEKISSRSALDQGDLDSLLNRSNVGDPRRLEEGLLPKGLREITLRQILNFLAGENREVSAEEVAEGIGLARVTARRYLEYLEKSGKVHLETRYGTVGRPVNKYRPTIPF